MGKILNHRIFTISIILFISSGILFFDIPRVDDVPYHDIVVEDCMSMDDLTDANPDDGKVCFKGAESAFADISLNDGQTVLVNFRALNNTENSVNIFVDLYEKNYDLKTVQRVCTVLPGENSYEAELSYYRENHPEKAKLRFFSKKGSPEIELTDISVNIANEVVNGNSIVNICQNLNFLILLITALYIFCYILASVKTRKGGVFQKRSLICDLIFYGCIVVSIIIILFMLYRKAILKYPLIFHGGDDLGIYYLIRSIKEYGLTLINHRSGGLSGGDLFDYPYSDKLSFIWVKLFTLLVDNVYLIANLIYFLSFILIALTSAFVCRKLKFSRGAAYAVAILYAFSPFIQQRYGHMWLTAYYMLPVAVLLAISIAEGRIKLRSNQYWNYAIAAFACGFTGMYYAWFSCAIFAAAIVIRVICTEKEERYKSLRYGIYIISCAFGVLVNVIPNIIYWVINGYNSAGEIALRTGAETETYGLKLAQMILPRIGHRIGFLANITQRYSSSYPLVNENGTATLGIISVIALIAAILNLLGIRKVWTESKLIVSMFLIGTIGGLGTIISVFVNLPMRCYNRISLLIMFLCLLLVARFIEWMYGRIPRSMSIVVILAIIAIGIFDQTVQYVPPDYTEFEASRNFIAKIEDDLDAGDMVFVLPALNWPTEGGYKNHIGYIESDNLIWSYGAAQGREEALWQKSVASMKTKRMIRILRQAGYEGIYFDSKLYAQRYGEDAMVKYSNNITYVLGYTPLVSDDGTLYFWDIRK